jgi:hypothetical protein
VRIDVRPRVLVLSDCVSGKFPLTGLEGMDMVSSPLFHR